MVKRLRAATVSQWLVSFCMCTVYLFGTTIVFYSRVPNLITPSYVLVMVIFDILLTVLVSLSIGRNNLEEASAEAQIQSQVQMIRERRLQETPTVEEFIRRYPDEYNALVLVYPDFFRKYCKRCGNPIYIVLWQPNRFDEDTGKPQSEVLSATCYRHTNIRKEISRPVAQVSNELEE